MSVAVNPAFALAELLESWHVPAHKTPQSQRFNGQVDSAEFWYGHRTAVRYLMEIEDALTAMEAAGEEMSFYRETVPTWYRAVFSQTLAWNVTSSDALRRVVGESELRLLRALGAHIAAVNWVPTLDPSHIDSLREALKLARDLVLTDGDLAPYIRRYILGLIHEASQCLDEASVTDSVLVRKITMELGGAMTTVSEMKSGNDPSKRSWAEAARNVLRSVGDKLTQKAIEMGVDQAANVIGNLS